MYVHVYTFVRARSHVGAPIVCYICVAFLSLAQVEPSGSAFSFVAERSMTWTSERLLQWVQQWAPEEWRRTIEASEWNRLEWAVWWNHVLRMAQEESDRLWALVPQYPLVFGEITLQAFVPDRRLLFRRDYFVGPGRPR